MSYLPVPMNFHFLLANPTNKTKGGNNRNELLMSVFQFIEKQSIPQKDSRVKDKAQRPGKIRFLNPKNKTERGLLLSKQEKRTIEILQSKAFLKNFALLQKGMLSTP